MPVEGVPALPDPAEPMVTVVIPARNEEAAIGPCLDSVLAQDWTNLQVIVVDGASEDATAAIVTKIAERDPRVELLHNPRGIIPASLNLAVSSAKGEWLVRIDAHATVPSDYVRRAAEHLQTGRYGGVGGRKDGVGRTPAGKAIAAVMASRFGVGGSTYHHGTTVTEVEHVPFGAYPVAVIRAVGGWDEQLRVNQDFEFDHRVREAGASTGSAASRSGTSPASTAGTAVERSRWPSSIRSPCGRGTSPRPRWWSTWPWPPGRS
jgi:succinoglycan biosynthesis protein ExoA